MTALLLQLLPVVLPYGVQAVTQLIKIFSSSTAPTQADWDALVALTQTTARQQMLATLQKHGIDPASPQGVALLALTPA